MKACLVCQQDKAEQRKVEWLLELLPIPSRPWKSIFMDLFFSLPMSEGYAQILMVYNRLSKYNIFMLAPKECPLEEMTWLFLKHMVKYFGIPQIISN